MISPACPLSTILACCAHHLTDLLPLMGLAAAAAFLTHYQLVFILVGVVSNLLGLTYMLSIIARHHLYFASNRWLAWLASFDYRRVFQVEIPALVAVLVAGSLFLYRPTKGASAEPPAGKQVEQTVILEPREVVGNEVWVEVQGQYDRQRGTVDFAVKFTTHSGSLDFQVEKIASLRIDDRELTLPVSWEGSPPGGHHRSGKLHYERLPAEIGTIALTLSADGRLGVRRFAWDVQSPQTRRENHGTGSRM